MDLQFELNSMSLHTPKLCEKSRHINSCLSTYIQLKVPVHHAKWLTYQYISTYQFCVLNTFALKVRFSILADLYLEIM